ncbi:MAG TPA: GGDEF domain-containing protein [Candidatus Binatia bacterium]|nr:GGDEF domain-containing protein [Candidatus Binatia bacterium]
MDRSDATRALVVAVTVLVAALPLGLLAALGMLPPVMLDGSDLAWLPTALALGLALAASGAALAAMTVGLRHGDLPLLASAGASAALAGGVIGALATSSSLSVPLLVAAGFMLVAASAGRLPPLDDLAPAIAGAALVIVIAEAAALVEILPPTAELLAPLRQPILLGAVVLAAVATIRSRGGLIGMLTMIGAAGLLASRGTSLEWALGVTALTAGQLIALRAALEPRPAAEEEDVRLPDLAARLSDAVLRFDGRLKLRDWNAAAAALLGLDATSIGTRLEDLLGTEVGELPAEDQTIVTHSSIGGLEIAMHRAGGGIAAVIRDPGTVPETERLGNELRSTIEELLRARRTIDLQRDELERASTVDGLTGVSSRSAILDRLRVEMAQARRYRHPLAVVLLDVDDFADLNHVHGIEGGDAILREVALRIRLRVREADALGRAGSDGFIAALPHTDEGGAATFADALRHRLALRPVMVGEATVPITVSIGVATMRPGEELDLNGLLERVDEALASARGAGGNGIALDREHGLARLEEKCDLSFNHGATPEEDSSA